MSTKGKVTLAIAVAALIVAPPAQGAPSVRGSTHISTGPFVPCSASCAPFFEAGCPADMAEPDGVTTSIVDMTQFRGETLTFEWADVSTQFYDDLEPHADSATPRARVFFYEIAGCTQPPWFSFVLNSSRDGRSTTWTVSDDATWLLVESADVSGAAEWWAG